ncbi:LysR family transcriptional regulator [Martelella endophytica]|uniref:LysR family transcriptional regulator n=1 Tax=Martelella endophytica TaxID=1486262 RepID=A0A0D5LVT3_MAREN|nr:LysR family transcriptional regulator [Martelella endophytica]AJY48075.1 LysR family transcriptional regulator [Martelella endophytica]
MNERPTLAELSAFAAVARHLSFRAAAEALDIGPSTLSHMIRDLEARLGVRLFNRTTRSVALTEAGQRFAGRVHPLLEGLDDALDEVGSAGDTARGRLRISASETVAALLLRRTVPAFLQRFPDVTLDLVAEPQFTDIVAGGYDAAFRLGEAVPLDMVAVKIGGPSRMVTVAAPAYLAGHAAPQTPSELTGHALIASRTPAGRPQQWEFGRNGEVIRIEAEGRLVLNRTELMTRAALAGLGIAYVPERIAAAHLETGALRLLLDDWCPSYPGLSLYYPGHRLVPARLRAFIAVLRAVPP